jgi:colicin import membrane protein
MNRSLSSTLAAEEAGINPRSTMSTETIPTPISTTPPSDDPFHYGWRMVRVRDQDGNELLERVGLSAWDVLHPEEEDFVVQTPAHTIDCVYLFDVFRDIVRDQPGMLVFCDMRINWQLNENSVFGPDISVFENVHDPIEPQLGTFPVRTMGASSVVVVEVISPTTELIDKEAKVREYRRVGVPLYVIVDHEEVAGQSVVNVYGYRMTTGGYERIPDVTNGIWIERLRVWIRSIGDRVGCFDEWGKRIPERAELREQRDALQKERNEEKQRAEQEKQRADENARKLSELEAELRRLRNSSN